MFQKKKKQCDLKIKCDSCQHQCDFSDKIILTLFLKGLQDTDLQIDLLAEQDLDLDKCLRMATARETAKRSQDTINTPAQAVDKISAYKDDTSKIRIPRDCCTGCGKKKHSDKTACPAKDTVCSCGRTGHYEHLCFRKGKPRKPKMAKEKIENEAKEQTSNTESSNLLSESCFHLQAGIEDNKDEVSGMNDFQKENTETMLNSLWCDDKNRRWITEISDEGAN